MQLIYWEVQITIPAPRYISHIIQIKPLELPLVQIAVVLGMWILTYPRAEIKKHYNTIIKPQVNLQVSNIHRFFYFQILHFKRYCYTPSRLSHTYIYIKCISTSKKSITKVQK